MRFAQPPDTLLQPLQVIARRPALAHFPGAPFFRHRRGDEVLVDIQPKIEFFLFGVFAGSRLFKLQRSGTSKSRPLVRLSPQKGGAACE
jgi:hypothetical protein